MFRARKPGQDRKSCTSTRTMHFAHLLPLLPVVAIANPQFRQGQQVLHTDVEDTTQPGTTIESQPELAIAAAATKKHKKPLIDSEALQALLSADALLARRQRAVQTGPALGARVQPANPRHRPRRATGPRCRTCTRHSCR